MNSLTERPKGHTVDLLFSLALFCAFAASAVFAVVIGARVYKSTVSHMEANSAMRTSMAYIATKVRQGDEAGAVFVETQNGLPTLVLEQTFDNQVFQTRVYCYEGSLRELLVRGEETFSPELGQAILAIQDFSVQQAEDSLLRFSVTDNEGRIAAFSILLRTADTKEAAA